TKMIKRSHHQRRRKALIRAPMPGLAALLGLSPWEALSSLTAAESYSALSMLTEARLQRGAGRGMERPGPEQYERSGAGTDLGRLYKGSLCTWQHLVFAPQVTGELNRASERSSVTSNG
ncbi:MAG: hypothetical protein M1815_006028, partial [Lichina confinis]